MNTGILKQSFNRISSFIVNNQSTIFTATGIGCVISIPFVTVKPTIKALELIDEAADVKLDEEGRISEGLGVRSIHDNLNILTTKEVIFATWKCYIPTFIMTSLAIGCFVAAHRSNSLQKAALASAYSLVEKSYDKYKDKVIEVIGEEKNNQIKEEIAKETLESTDSEQIIPFGNGEYLCYDGISGRYFKSDIETVREAINDFNYILNGDFYQDLNDWYIRLGLPQIQLGELMGWNSEKHLDITFTSTIASNGEPCIVLDYSDSLPSPFYRR